MFHRTCRPTAPSTRPFTSTTSTRGLPGRRRRLHVDRPAQLHASVAYRYREVKDVYIYSLVNFLDRPDDEDVYECVLDEDTALRAVPNISTCSVLTRYGRPDDRTKQIYGLDVCLRREQIEAIIKERPGGSDFLFSEARFLNLLGMGTRHVVVPDEGKELYVVKYDEIELGEIKRFVEEATLDVKKLSPEAVTGAIKRSFGADVRGPLHPSGQCYLSETSFYALKNMGIPIYKASFLNVDEWEAHLASLCVMTVPSIAKYPLAAFWLCTLSKEIERSYN